MASDPTRRPGAPLASHLAAVAILVGMAWAADTSVAHKSPTFDETAHLTAGFSYWHTGDTRLNPENGVLPQLWAALPAWLSGAAPPDLSGEPWRHRVVWTLGQQFFYDVGNDLEGMLRSARRMVLIFTLALGALVYAWSTRLFGPRGGLVSLWLYAFCPNVLAHGP